MGQMSVTVNKNQTTLGQFGGCRPWETGPWALLQISEFLWFNIMKEIIINRSYFKALQYSRQSKYIGKVYKVNVISEVKFLKMWK